MKRLAALMLLIILAALPGIAASASAATTSSPSAKASVVASTTDDVNCRDGECYGFGWSGTHWVDSACGTGPLWRVQIFRDANFGGEYTSICSWQNNFCHVPLGIPPLDDSITGTWGICFPGGDYAHDTISSIKWWWYGARDTGHCIVLYPDVGYAGTPYLRMQTTQDSYITNLGWFSIGNDHADAIKITTPATCYPS